MTAVSKREMLITDRGDPAALGSYELPYSKGLMASSIMATGLAPARAFHVAEVVEARLASLDRTAIGRGELTALVLEVLHEEVGDRYAATFAKWQAVRSLDRPLVVLLGGATGVGKSTIATMLAARLGITRVIPTDAVREVMRSMFSNELLPTLHASSFDTARLVRHPLPADTEGLIVGFREQVAAIVVGIHALIARAVDEGTDLILEGAHIVPGFLDLARYAPDAVVVPLVVTVDDEDRHRGHFVARGSEVGPRPAGRYMEAFADIRRLQRYMKSLALQHDVPVVPAYDLDDTLGRVIDLVVAKASSAVADDTVPTAERGTE